jgi:hypothetical protein
MLMLLSSPSDAPLSRLSKPCDQLGRACSWAASAACPVRTEEQTCSSDALPLPSANGASMRARRGEDLCSNPDNRPPVPTCYVTVTRKAITRGRLSLRASHHAFVAVGVREILAAHLNRLCQHTPVTRRSGLRVSIMNPSASAPSSVQTVA